MLHYGYFAAAEKHTPKLHAGIDPEPTAVGFPIYVFIQSVLTFFFLNNQA